MTLRRSTLLSAGAFERRRAHDVRDYMGAGPDIGAWVNAAITAAAAETPKGQVIIPPGNWAQTTEINPQSGVDIIGSGWGRTVIRPQGYMCSFKRLGTQTDQLADLLIANFEVDGSAQAHFNPGSYDSTMKAFLITHTVRARFQELYLHHTGSTGLGIDFLADCFIDHIYTDRCGRLNDGTGPGGAGIGIGTGAYGVERTTISDCVTRNSGKDGIFFETQAGNASTSGFKLVNHHSEGCTGHGIADAGVSSLLVVGGETRNNGKAGFAAYNGSLTGGQSWPGRNGLVMGLHAIANTGPGILVDTTVVDGGDDYTFSDVKARANQFGVLISCGASPLSGVTVRDCDLYANNQSGIRVQSAGGQVEDIAILGNRIYNNGQTVGATSRSGIHIGTSVTRLRVVGNQCFDKQATKTQQAGMTIEGVTVTSGEFGSNDFRDNAGIGVSQNGTLSSTRVGRNLRWTVDAGAPETIVKAPVGTLYQRVDGGAATTLYVKESGADTATGWVAK